MEVRAPLCRLHHKVLYYLFAAVGATVAAAVGGGAQMNAPTPEISFPEQAVHSEPPSAYFPAVQLVQALAAAAELFPLGQ